MVTPMKKAAREICVYFIVQIRRTEGPRNILSLLLHFAEKLAQQLTHTLKHSARGTRIVLGGFQNFCLGEARLHLAGSSASGPPAGLGTSQGTRASPGLRLEAGGWRLRSRGLGACLCFSSLQPLTSSLRPVTSSLRALASSLRKRQSETGRRNERQVGPLPHQRHEPDG